MTMANLPRSTTLKALLPLLALMFLPVTGKGDAVADTLTARRVFEEIDFQPMRILTPETRMDMADYCLEHRPYQAVNVLGGISRLDTLTPSFAKLDLTRVSDVEMMCLPTPKGEVVGLIYTLDADGADSQLFMYGNDLKPLPVKKYFTPPGLKDFVLATHKDDRQAIALVNRLAPFITASYSFVPDKEELVATLTIPSIIPREDYDRLRCYFIHSDEAPTLTYAWNGRKFVKK